MKKIAVAAAFILLLLLGVYVAGNLLLKEGSRQALVLAKAQAKTLGIHLEDAHFKSVSISSFRSVTWHQINARFRVSGNQTVSAKATFDLLIDRLTASLINLSAPSVRLRASQLHLAPTSQTLQTLVKADKRLPSRFQMGSVEGKWLETVVAVNMQRPLDAIRHIGQTLKALAQTGRTTADIDLQGKVQIRLQDTVIEARLHTVKDRTGARLALNLDDVETIASRFGDRLTSAELNLITENPVDTPRLFMIKDYAETTARKAYTKDNKVPEDAYRHVLWSYLLTKEFGPAFAKRVTDAHEQGPTGNTPQERKQDYHNNAVGRRYARAGISQDKLLRLVRTDPKVMRKFGRRSRRR